ncbi:hypothetical protein, partial [Pseudomonas saponiphila]|uniref:hypothetical protein n=1 Tax=Pseudomonas saponiphila TaxID=556534 RepID=UPI00223F6DFB
ETLGKAELKGRTFGDTEFVIGHSGSTVPERSGVALSFCGRRHIKLKNFVVSAATQTLRDLNYQFLFNSFHHYHP